MLPPRDIAVSRLALLLLAPLLAVSGISACSPFDESLLPSASTGEQIGCTAGSNRPPPRPAPSATADAGVEGEDFWVALKDVLLDQGNDAWATIGYNVDSRCTDANNAAETTECTPVPGRAHEVDGNLGTDNSFGHNLFPLLDLAFPGLDETAIEAEERGLGAVLIRIRGWNREPNDSNVQIIVTQSVFGTPSNAGAEPDIMVIGSEAFLNDGVTPAPEPIWDGTDYFWGRDDTFGVPSAIGMGVDAATPLVADNNAYVSNGVLVATIPDGTEVLLVGDGLGTRVKLSGMIASANLVDLMINNEPSTTVTISGRWGFNDLLRTAETVGVCPGSTQFRLLQTQVQAITDVLLDPDPQNLGTMCDAVSIGITFEAFRANFGGIAEGQDLPNPCAVTP